VTTLVLPPRYTEDSLLLSRAAQRAGWDVERLPSWHIPPPLREEDVVLYAEPLFVMHAAPQVDLALLETPYDWLPGLPRRYVARDVRLTTLRDARRLTGERFVKPAMEKFFAAAVVSSGEALPGPDVASDVLPVLVSDVVAWEAEFRCFVLGRRCVAMSPYLIAGELARTEDGQWTCDEALCEHATRFAGQLLNDPAVRMPPALVVDIGKIRGGPWAVVEANPAWGSGIYGCDPDRALEVVRRSCVKADRLVDADKPWVIDHSLEDFT
jgi:hypothetical protein